MSYETGLSMEERVTSLFQPDTLLPDQYIDTFRRKLYLEPEKKLMLAILEDAIACYQKYIFARDSKGKALFEECAAWVEERGGASVFAFDAVCETLGMNPDYLRRGITGWAKAALAQRSKAKIYQLEPRPQRQRRGVTLARKATRRMRRAAGR